MDATTKRMVTRNQATLANNIAKMKREAQESAAGGSYRLAGATYLDVADLLAVAEAIKAEDFDCARRLVCDLESVPRDEIPCELYRWLFKSN